MYRLETFFEKDSPHETFSHAELGTALAQASTWVSGFHDGSPLAMVDAGKYRVWITRRIDGDKMVIQKKFDLRVQ